MLGLADVLFEPQERSVAYYRAPIGAAALASGAGSEGQQRMPASNRLLDVLREVKVLAREYYELTGRPLGVTAEIAEYEAARLSGSRSPPRGRPVTTLYARLEMASGSCR